MLSSILGSATLHEDHSFSFEAHPNNTTEEHLKTLYNFGFRRVSLGVQDFDLEVQKRINRVQSFETVERVSLLARDMGYSSLNFDLIYGLPSQQPSSISGTLKHVETLMPDRIALYSYAHVPWKEKGQRGFTEDEIPQGEEKRALYELAKDGLLKLGYMDIGMDHFSLPTDSLYRAKVEKRLHRNFMGYNTSQSSLLIGLGASSISDAGNAYAQNTKDIEAYKESMLNSDEWNHTNGVFLTDDDIVLKSAILSISCHGELVLDSRIKDILGVDLMHSLQEMENEGLIKTQKDSFSLTEIGTVFLRNVCSLFDPYFKGSMSSIGKKEDGKDKNRFSKAL